LCIPLHVQPQSLESMGSLAAIRLVSRWRYR
jgi:hypothetical protein